MLQRSDETYKPDTDSSGRTGSDDKEGDCPLCDAAAGVDGAECMELCLGMDEEPNESLWIRIKEQSKGAIIVSVC